MDWMESVWQCYAMCVGGASPWSARLAFGWQMQFYRLLLFVCYCHWPYARTLAAASTLPNWPENQIWNVWPPTVFKETYGPFTLKQSACTSYQNRTGITSESSVQRLRIELCTGNLSADRIFRCRVSGLVSHPSVDIHTANIIRQNPDRGLYPSHTTDIRVIRRISIRYPSIRLWKSYSAEQQWVYNLETWNLYIFGVILDQ